MIFFDVFKARVYIQKPLFRGSFIFQINIQTIKVKKCKNINSLSDPIG